MWDSWQSFTVHGRGPLVVALSMLTVILVAGFLLPKSQHLGSLMVVVPATTAALAGSRITALSGVLSCLGALALDIYDNLLNTSIFAVHLLAIALVSAFVITFGRYKERNIRELTEVRAVSETVQRILLRPLPPRVGDLRIAAVYHASHPHALVGGDLYAAARTDEALRVVIGDVKGKGLPAVDDAAALLAAFRGAPHKGLALPELVAHLEVAMRAHFEDAERREGDVSERFVTLLVLEIPDTSADVRMINCGHPPLYLVSRTGARAVSPGVPTPPIGLNSVHAEDYAVDTFLLDQQSTILLYTDGAIEARDSAGRFYDLQGRVVSWRHAGPGDLIRHVLDGLAEHVGGEMRLDDDIALVAVSYSPDGDKAGLRQPAVRAQLRG
ncbi:PP2C family protein-serine/threonine phosphatase [Streptomyces sp. NPDC089424]|uniref:PP2C family protein-serine/threonine phosphatase n=1 Tax=Streptomyces sp. NPDC089424 TaxID=3365917 RepID=UPI003806AB8B